ncbi:MAG: hypothetical protein L3J01_03255, partial [Thiomicrorhabdus sp.]|nr:hypothetical protein [Thiomicrorhabdus sp.]
MLKKTSIAALFLAALTVLSPPLFAEEDDLIQPDTQMDQNVNDAEYKLTIAAFRNAKSGQFFDHAYGFAVFPTIGKVGFIVGGAYGEGRVYEQGQYK